MKNHKLLRADWQALAMGGGLGGTPPGGRGPRVAVAGEPRKPSLTQTFNAAAKKPVLHDVSKSPVYKRQIEVLKRQMSQPRHTLEMTPLGSVLRSRNVEKDRRLMETMTALTERLGKQKGLSKRFATAEKKGQLKAHFNKSARGLGM